MKEEKNNQEDQLKEQKVIEQMPGKEEFWQEFKSRAQDLIQDKPESAESVPYAGFMYWKIAACFLLVTVAIWGYQVYNEPGNNENGLAAQGGSVIENYEFFTPNDGVMIWQDQDGEDQSSATILWVIDSEDNLKKEDKNET